MKSQSQVESNHRLKSLREITEILVEHKEEIHRKYKVNKIGIFGSYVRDEQRRTSDIDILVDFENEESRGFEFIGLMIELESFIQKLLGIKPHLASQKACDDIG